MTLDQVIDRYTNNAEYERIHGSLQGCLEFRQLAEWLKDYKRLLEQQPCDDAISRDAVLNGLKGCICDEWVKTLFATMVKQLPSVTQKSGKWVFVDKAKEHAHCSECDYGNVDLFDGRPHNYCPNCGAKMQESEEV